jgi:hypothetical protein
MEYNPFGKLLDELAIDDLTRLRDVCEGWYVEYKRIAMSPAAIAKSISALANTRGGWLFYGVDAPSGSVGVAIGFPGISTTDVPATLQRIRDSVAAHLSTVPFFEVKPLDGPSVALSLSSGQTIIAIHVPQGVRPPYVHTSGVIYVRVADKSDPVKETDRNRLANLFERAQRAETRLERLFTRRSLDSGDRPIAQIFVLVDPYDEHRWRHRLQFRDFARIVNPDPPASKQLESAADLISNIGGPFPIVQSGNAEFVARQANPGTLHGMSLRFSSRSNSVIRMPLLTADIASIQDLSRYLDGYEHASTFCDLWRAANTGPVRVIDLTAIFGVMVGLFHRVRGLLDACHLREFKGELFVKILLHNVGGVVPFIDIPAIIEHITALDCRVHKMRPLSFSVKEWTIFCRCHRRATY